MRLNGMWLSGWHILTIIGYNRAKYSPKNEYVTDAPSSMVVLGQNETWGFQCVVCLLTVCTAAERICRSCFCWLINECNIHIFSHCVNYMTGICANLGFPSDL
jgi:hypothetical protein